MKAAKRLLCMLLSLCLVLGMLPGTVLAASNNLPFTDVNTTDWFHGAVQYVYEKGMMSGTSTTTFAPGGTTTRGMIVTVLHRIEGNPSASGTAFTDVPADQWYADAVAWASANKIVSGYGNGVFGPNDAVTREQMVAILYRYSQYKNYDVSTSGKITSFSDAAQISSYAESPMSWAIGTGLISGFGNNTLDPKGNATRAQAATILMRYCESVVPYEASNKPESTYTVTFNLNYGSEPQYDVKTVKAGETVDMPTNPSRSGYSFNGWYTEKSGGKQFDFKTGVTSDLTLYAHWSNRSSSDGGGSSGGGSTRPNLPLEITITNAGYDTENSSLITKEASIKVTGTVSGNVNSVTATYAGYNTENTAANVLGASNWTTDIPLQIGTNTVTIKAIDNVGASVEKVVYINRTSTEIIYKSTVKVADEEDYQTIANGAVATWVDNNGTPANEDDDYIVMLVEDTSLLMSQINDGLLSAGEVYMIPQNEIFLTGFTGVYVRHQAPRGTENYPLSLYPDAGYEELVFDFPGFDDLFAEDISLDFSGGIDSANPIAFAVLADGTPIDLNYSKISSRSMEAPYNIATYSDTIGNSLFPREGWQFEELGKAILPNVKCSIDNYNRANVGLSWSNVPIYDKDGVKGTTYDQYKLSGELGIKNLKYTGGMEWHPSFVPWDFQVLPQQLIQKIEYNFTGSLTVSREIDADNVMENMDDVSMSTSALIKQLNGNFSNKTEFWGLSLSGVDTLNSKWVLGSVGLNLFPPCATFATTIKGQASASTLTPMLVLYIFLDVDGNVSVEGSIAFSYDNKIEKGFNIQRNGYTGAYGSQAQNRSDKHYTIGSDYTLDVYDSTNQTTKLTFGGKVNASLDLGPGVGACLMIGGFAPASIDGEVFFRAQGTAEAEGELQFYPEIALDGSAYAGIYMGLGVQADIAAKILLKYKKHNLGGFDFDKHWEHMFWEKEWSTSKLDGTVYVADADADNTNNTKIEGAKVTLIKQDTQKQWTARTNADGKYEIKSIPDGKYSIKVEKSGYDVYTNDNLIFTKKQTLDVFLNQQAQQPGICNLSGRIVIADDDIDLTNSDPLDGALVSLVNLTTGTTASDTTGNDGMYMIGNLVPGNYKITITKTGYITISETVSVADNVENYYNAALEVISEIIEAKSIVTTISAGDYHSGVIDENGSLWVWGSNDRGQLGNGTKENALSPIKIMDNVQSISVGTYHTAVIQTDGSLWIWGCNHEGELGNGITGNDEGYIWDSWGGDDYPIQTVPVKIMEDVSAVSCGNEFTAVIKNDGSLWMWGRNGHGQIGNGTTENVTTPVKIMEDVVAVCAGLQHTTALQSDGTLWAWGNNDYYLETNNDSLSPVKILDNVVSISEGAHNTAAIRDDGSLWMCGWISYDGLNASTSDTMIQVLPQVSSVSLGYSHYGVIMPDKSLWMWGNGDYGRLGLPSGTQSDPTKMSQSTMDDVVLVDIGRVHTIAVKSDGSVWTWGGQNINGELGIGTTNSSRLPTQIPGLIAKIPSSTES